MVVIVYHLGDRATSGRYLALLGRPKGSGWEYVVCDDNRPPQGGLRRLILTWLIVTATFWVSCDAHVTAQGPRGVGPQQQPPCPIRATA